MRYLYTADNQLFAYAPGRRDFFLSGNDQLWAHESHGWLIAAKSGETLAHRTGDVYFGAVDGAAMYRLAAHLDGADLDEANPESTEHESGEEPAEASAARPQRVARARR
jgi:hypothetical protein